MIGKYDIEVYNNKVHYSLTVRRNITVIQGFSATGKSELIRLISQYEAFGNSSGITIKSEVPCKVLTGPDWEIVLRSTENSIIFIDENVNFTRKKEFARLVAESDNYFVIVTRDDLSELTYSVDEIYGLRDVSDTQKYKTFHKVYNEMYRLYNFDIKREYQVDRVILEDSNSGYEFFHNVLGDICMSSYGKSNVYKKVVSSKDTELVIVDGAAFGDQIGKLIRYIESNKKDCVIYAPESFEYVILSSGLLNIDNNVLEETYNYADSTKYISWERFYTQYLVDISRDTVYRYNKSKLNSVFLDKTSVNRIMEILPDIIKNLRNRKDDN